MVFKDDIHAIGLPRQCRGDVCFNGEGKRESFWRSLSSRAIWAVISANTLSPSSISGMIDLSQRRSYISLSWRLDSNSDTCAIDTKRRRQGIKRSKSSHSSRASITTYCCLCREDSIKRSWETFSFESVIWRSFSFYCSEFFFGKLGEQGMKDSLDVAVLVTKVAVVVDNISTLKGLNYGGAVVNLC